MAGGHAGTQPHVWDHESPLFLLSHIPSTSSHWRSPVPLTPSSLSFWLRQTSVMGGIKAGEQAVGRGGAVASSALLWYMPPDCCSHWWQSRPGKGAAVHVSEPGPPAVPVDLKHWIHWPHCPCLGWRAEERSSCCSSSLGLALCLCQRLPSADLDVSKYLAAWPGEFKAA